VEQNLVVISKSDEIRSSFAESYSLLGYEVSVYDDILQPIRDLNLLDPDHVVLDIDELARRWKIVASGLRLAQKRITLILIAGSMTLEQANEALILGASGIIIKPFLPEFHLKRVYDILHRKQRAQGKRIYPRFYAGEVFDGDLVVHSEATRKIHTLELVNVSEIGVAVRSRDPESAPELQPRSTIDKAVLRIDNEEFPLSARVVFRKGGLIGLVFEDIRSREANFRRLLQRLCLKAFGISGLKGKW
jgi:DNA-binding response OmpR family regulator